MQEKLKIIQLFDSYGDFYQPYIPPVINALKKQEQFAIKVYVFNKDCKDDVHIIPSYKKRKIKEKYYHLVNSKSPKLNYLEITAFKKKIDIIHLQHSFLFPKILGLLKLPAAKRPKIIITLRGGDTYVKPWYQKKWQEFYKNHGNEVDAFVVMSNHQKNYLQDKWQIEKQRIHVIPISFGMPEITQPKIINTKTLKLVSVFRMCWEKNIDGNLLTIKHLIDKGIPVHYHVYGDGPDVGQLFYLIDKYHLKEHVTYHGKVENKELKKQLLAYHVFLQLSHSEALPTSVLEAQSLGLPAVVSTSGGLPEAILHDVTGYCVAPNAIDEAANYIKQLWQTPERYTAFSKAAIIHSQTNFTTEKEVEKLMKLYQTFKKN